MDKAEFWKLLEDSKAQSDGDCEEQAALLEQALTTYSPEDIVAFDRILDSLRDAAYRWDLWGAAYLINGGASDDGFEYFRGWLIAQGQAVYENALRDPDSLADVIEADLDDAECENLFYCAPQAYEKKAGQEMPVDREYQQSKHGEPTGVQWQEDELDALLPRLAAKVNSELT